MPHERNGKGPSSADDASPFWAFSLRVYARQGVAERALALQDQHGLDVNLLLACLWWGLEGPGPLSEAQLDACLARTGAWQAQAVVPLRAVRRWLKHAPGGFAREHVAPLRVLVQQAELEAERLEQLRLERTLHELDAGASAGQPGPATAAGNLRRYARRAGLRADDAAANALLDALLAAAGK